MAPPDKRRGKRGRKPTTLAKKGKVSFVDPQPADRYNLVFYAKYRDKDVVLQETDKAFLEHYHQVFPRGLGSYSPWGKSPGSRSHCEAHLFKQVSSLYDIANEMYKFLSFEKDDDKKLGTIIITGHGTPTEFALPITTGGDRLALAELEIGLRHADALGDRPPSEWPGSATNWKKFKSQFMKLEVQTAMLKRHVAKRTDEQTLIRMWCCNLGKTPSGGKDPLEIFGKVFLGTAKFMIEAPRNRSGNLYRTFSLPSSPSDKLLAKIFRDETRKNKTWHPDTIADVESDAALKKLKGQTLLDARSLFTDDALQSAPPPGMKSRAKWIPVFLVEDDSGKSVFPATWSKFQKLWRRVTV